MLKLLIFIILLTFYNPALATLQKNIVSKMELINNLSFDFIQIAVGKSEKGSCIIEYPKKIYCEYDNSNKKIIVSNGKSLVIKNKNSGNYYIYPLKQTPLELILDKNYLISKIKNLEPQKINNGYLNFQILENKKYINIFFDKDTFALAGWQTRDIYQNLTETLLSSVKINKKINDDIFILPK